MQTIETPIEERATLWKNNNSFPQRVDLRIDGRLVRFSWKPGEAREVPSRYDSSIQVVHGKTVIGGLAPALTNMSLPEDERPALHQALDEAASLRKVAEAEAVLAQARVKQAADAAIVAEAAAASAKTAKKN